MTFGGLAGGFAKQVTLPSSEKNQKTPIRRSRIVLGELHFGLLTNYHVLFRSTVEPVPSEKPILLVTQASIAQVFETHYGGNTEPSSIFGSIATACNG